MLFNSIDFLVFFPTVTLVFFLIPRKLVKSLLCFPSPLIVGVSPFKSCLINFGITAAYAPSGSTGKSENVAIFADNPNYTFIKGDIKNLQTCMDACEGVDFVLNQAAWGSVPRSIEMPLFYCANNIFAIQQSFNV